MVAIDVVLKKTWVLTLQEITIIERGVSRRGDATKGQGQEEGKALIKSYG